MRSLITWITQQTLEKFSRLFVKLGHEGMSTTGEAGKVVTARDSEGWVSCLVLHADIENTLQLSPMADPQCRDKTERE